LMLLWYLWYHQTLIKCRRYVVLLPHRTKHLLLQHPLLLIVVFSGSVLYSVGINRCTMQLIMKLLFIDAKLID